MFLYSNHKDFFILNSHSMSANCKKLSMAFVRHHVHGTQNFEISYCQLVSSCPSLIVHSSYIIKKSSLCFLLFIWTTSSPLAHLLIQQFITTLAYCFSLKDFGNLAYFLRVEVIHTSFGLFLSQYKYIYDILEKHNMLGANAVSTSISYTMFLKFHDGPPLTDPTKYH